MSGSDTARGKLRPYGIKRIVERHPTEAAKVVWASSRLRRGRVRAASDQVAS
ncbi:hypothetical protein DHODJN_13995 [Methylorubrum extorquens]